MKLDEADFGWDMIKLGLGKADLCLDRMKFAIDKTDLFTFLPLVVSLA